MVHSKEYEHNYLNLENRAMVEKNKRIEFSLEETKERSFETRLDLQQLDQTSKKLNANQNQMIGKVNLRLNPESFFEA